MKNTFTKDLSLEVTKASPNPAYLQIAEALRSHIQRLDAPAGTALPDLQTLANVAGVSIRTMDQALKILIDEQVCFRRPKKGTFIGSPSRTKSRQRLCLVYCLHGLEDIVHDQVRQRLHQGINEACREAGIDTLLAGSEIRQSLTNYRSSTNLEIEGVLLVSWRNTEEITELANDFSGIRFVCLNYQMPGFDETPANVFGVFNNDYAGGYQTADLLARREHHSLAVLTMNPLENLNYKNRVRGFQDGAQAAGIPPRLVKIHTVEGLHPGGVEKTEIAKVMAKDILKTPSKPTGIFCVNDFLAAGICDYVAEQGMEGSIEVFGYDNLNPELCWKNHFSSVSVDFVAQGHRAVQILTRPQRQLQKIHRIVPELALRSQSLAFNSTLPAA